MLWVVVKGASYQIIGCNIHEKDGVHQLWVEQANGKTRKVKEDADIKEVSLIKDAIDYAIETNETTLRLA